MAWFDATSASHVDALYRLLMSIWYAIYTDSMIIQSETMSNLCTNISSSIWLTPNFSDMHCQAKPSTGSLHTNWRRPNQYYYLSSELQDLFNGLSG